MKSVLWFTDASALAALLCCSLLLGTEASGQERTWTSINGVSVMPPAGWDVAPDSLTQVLNTWMREVAGPMYTSVEALLSPSTSPFWTAHPYLLVRYDTVTYRSYEELEAEMASAGAQMLELPPSITERLEGTGVSLIAFDQVTFDRMSGTMWVLARAIDPTNGPSLTLSGSQFYDRSRVSISYYGAADSDPEFVFGLVRSVFRTLRVDGQNRLTPSSSGRAEEPAQGPTRIVAVAGLGLAVAALGGFVLFTMGGVSMLTKTLGVLMVLAGAGLWLPAKFMGIGPLAEMGSGWAFALLAVLCWGGLLMMGAGEKREGEPGSSVSPPD